MFVYFDIEIVRIRNSLQALLVFYFNVQSPRDTADCGFPLALPDNVRSVREKNTPFARATPRIPAAGIPPQPLIWCSESRCSIASSSPEECFFHTRRDELGDG